MNRAQASRFSAVSALVLLATTWGGLRAGAGGSAESARSPVGSAVAVAEAHLMRLAKAADADMRERITEQRDRLAAVRAASDVDRQLTPHQRAAEFASIGAGAPSGERLAAAPSHGSPSAAIAAIAAARGMRMTAAQRADAHSLDALAPEVVTALSEVLNGFLDFAAAAGDAKTYADASAAAKQLLLARRGTLVAAAGRLGDAVGSADSTASAGGTVSLCPAVAIDLSGQADSYPDDCAFVIDTGGDDIYTNNAGGVGGCDLLPAGELHAAAVFDYTGNDQYVSGDDCGVNGGAATGAALLLDMDGDDLYRAGGLGTNGGAARGTGLLLDLAGNDSYTATGIGTNGGSNGGAGMLVDLNGSDTYTAGDFGVNGGGRSGAGVLFDGSGDDTYTSWGFGANGGADLGGVGLLFDVGGVDSYTAVTWGVNGSGAGGVGLLIDTEGSSDTYVDDEGGTGIDFSVVPKGLLGAQIDAASPVPAPTILPTRLPSLPIADAFASDNCDSGGTNVLSGHVLDAYVKLRTRPDPGNAAVTWVCVAAEGGGSHLGGRLAVGGGSAGVPAGVDEDAVSVASCATKATNVRVQGGTVAGGQPYWVDVTPAPAGSDDAAWVCVRFTNSVGLRLRFSGGLEPGLDPSFVADPPVPHVPAYAESPWPVSGPSAACAAAPAGRTRYVNVTAGTTPVALYTWHDASRVHLCVRGGGAGGAGGRLTYEQSTGPGVSPLVTTAFNTDACPFDVITRDNPPSYGLYTSTPGATPAAACAAVAGFRLGVSVAGGGSTNPTWTPDPA